MLSSLFAIPHLHTLLIAFLVIIFIESALYYYRSVITEHYKKKKPEILSSEEAERESLRYFSKLHSMSVVRMVYVSILCIILVSLYDVRAFSFFAFAFGAIIIALRDVIISLLAYTHVVFKYDIGDDIRIGGVLGEIVRVRPLSTQLAGKDDRGDYNGKLHSVPNSKFLLEVVEQQEIKNGNHRRVTLHAVYNHEEYKDVFDVWLTKLKETLDTKLAKRSLKDVGNFKSYAGIKYKLHYDYDDDGRVIVYISFISTTKNALDKKETIIAYIESTKKPHEVARETK